jgi:hypothetical protein
METSLSFTRNFDALDIRDSFDVLRGVDDVIPVEGPCVIVPDSSAHLLPLSKHFKVELRIPFSVRPEHYCISKKGRLKRTEKYITVVHNKPIK